MSSQANGTERAALILVIHAFVNRHFPDAAISFLKNECVLRLSLPGGDTQLDAPRNETRLDPPDDDIVDVRRVRGTRVDEPAPPSECAADIMAVLHGLGKRLTTNEILTELQARGRLHGESTVKVTLARMVRDGELHNNKYDRPRGYIPTGGVS